MATPRWAASGPAKVFQSYGQCKGEERRRELVASLGASGDAEETFQRAALTLWSIALDGKAKKFAAAEGSTLPVLSLALTNRLEQLVGAKASAFDLDVTKAQAALQAARDAGSAQQVADASLALAAAQVLVEPNLEKLAEIVELVMGALTLLEEDKAGTAVALNILANVHILMGHGKDALRAAKQGLYALRSMGGQKIFEVPLLQTMMSACWLRSDSDEALRCCEEVAGICQEAKVDPVILALADGCTALASLANDEQGPAERKVETALKSLKDADGQILLLGALQEISFAIGKPVSALKAAQDLLEKERKRGVKEGVARALLLVSASSEEDEAKAKATEAKQLFGTLRDPLGEGLALVSLAKAQLASSTASALPVAKESFEAFQGCLVGQGFASSLLTLAYLRQEDAKQAERTSREALTMFQDGKHRVGQALAEFLLRRVLWVDPEFSSGRLARFGEVPCNTKVDILASRKNFGHPLLNGKEVNVGEAFQKLKDSAHQLNGSIDPSTMGWTSLGYCKDVFQMATEQLMQVGVPHLRGKVMTLKPLASGWEATIQSERGQRSVKSNAVIVATGAHPKKPTVLASKVLDVEVTFQQETLKKALAPHQRVAVLGNSHSAAVSLAKLGDLAVPLSLRVGCFGRRPLRCAEWLPQHDMYRYTSTGLKGFGAVFGRECMAKGTEWLEIKDMKDFDENQWDWVVDCTGYQQSPLPAISGVEEAKLLRDEAARLSHVATGRLGDFQQLYAVGVPWGKGFQDVEGFKGETTFVGFSLFLDRAILIADEIDRSFSTSSAEKAKSDLKLHRFQYFMRKSQELSQKPSECKIVIDDDRVAHVEIAGICTPKSLDFVLNALHQARVKEGVKAVVMLLRGSKGPVSPAGYPGTAGGLSATPQAQALASGSFLLGLRTLGLPMVVACVGKIAGPAWGLVLAADYRIAASTSTFILPIWGPPECFGDLVGHTVAMQLCYNQGPVSALTMLEYGVIHQCQRGEEETQSSAAEVARRIASTPSLACHQSTTMLSPAIEKYASIVARGGVRA
ncbi:Uncharacterized protein SCF082_LOCUS33064 [Durusdinium trenchii]|uniref:L-ornithine N(5)-monooxygenase n=1 Tax=Durusdinium trenchii TaxID=1381693 RepID=A0ABP0NKZ5_9DINO